MKAQLELPLIRPNHSRPLAGRRRRAYHAQWWFAQMRRVVDSGSETPSERRGDGAESNGAGFGSIRFEPELSKA